MVSRIIWLLTALAVVSVCITSVWRGFEVISYALVGNEPQAVAHWDSVAGLAFRAREYALTSADDPSDDNMIRKRRDEIVDMLEIRPLSSYYWLQLAESRVDANEPFSKASAAFQLSVLTGSNEGSIMTQRGMFGIWQWEVLSPEIQRRALADLAARRIPDSKIAWLRKTLSEKTEQVRQAIRLGLEANRFSDFARIGF